MTNTCESLTYFKQDIVTSFVYYFIGTLQVDSQFKTTLIAAIYALSIATFTALAAVFPKEGEPVMIIASPFKNNSALEVILSTDEGMLINSNSSWVAVATTKQNQIFDFVKQLYANGALLVLRASTTGLCSEPKSK